MDYAALKKNYVGLDLYRIIAAVVICAFHTIIHLDVNYGVMQSALQMGAVFMTAFFMLSGFSLFVNYAGRDVMKLNELKDFWIKRMIGIIPMYYIAAAIFLCFTYRGDTIARHLLLAPIELLCIQSNFSSLFSVSHNGGTWFISCIMMCYIVYPFLQEVSKQFSRKAKVWTILGCVFILFYAPVVVVKFELNNIYSNSFFRILEFTIGVLLASLKPELDQSKFVRKVMYRWPSIIVEFAALFYGITRFVKSGLYVGNYMLYSWICLPLFILILVGFSGVESKALNRSRIVRYGREISYVFFLAQLFSNKICKQIIQSGLVTGNLAKIGMGGYLPCERNYLARSI